MRGAQFWRLIITGALLIVSLYFLYPTLRLSIMSDEDKIQRPELVEQLTEKGIKLGLDLQGGMHLLMEPDMVAMLSNNAAKRDDALMNALREAERISDSRNEDIIDLLPSVFKREGIEMTEYFPTLGGSEADIMTAIKRERTTAIDGALEVVRSRVDQFGVAEPIIQKAASDRIIVELPGVQDAERARSLIQETAILEFQLVRRDKEVSKFVDDADRILRDNPQLLTKAYRVENVEPAPATDEKIELEDTDVDITTTEPEEIAEGEKPAETEIAETAPSADSETEETPGTPAPETETEVAEAESTEETMAASDLFGEGGEDVITDEDFPTESPVESRPFSGLVEVEGDVIMVPRTEYLVVSRLITMPEVKAALPRGAELVWAAKDEMIKGIQYRLLYLLNDRVEMTGDRVEKANFGFGSGNDPRSAGKPVVNMSFDSQGSRVFAQVTGSNIGRRLAIILNDRVYSAPVIRSKISSDAQISNIPDLEEAKMITIVLKAGALPVPLNIKSERTIGPTLGEDSIRKGVRATVFGLILVVIFMFVYYKASGIIADFALVINIFALMAGMAAFRATLTLPGIAGIILTMGMAVDANVLIFERIREELRSGKTVRAAIDAGYSRAFKTIIDANITTLITAAILYNFGTGPIKGFAVTLFMGIVISMITAIIVTRMIFEFVTSRRQVEKLSI